jgi:ankyrin repeat protein
MSVYEVRRDGARVGLWYFDPYARAGKSSGAWMNEYRTQERFKVPTTPIVSNNANFIPGKPGAPVLVSWDDAETMFHEFGHALHGLQSNVTYPTLAGTNVKRDFVEFPSQVNERWFLTDEVLSQYALHHKTGQPMPKQLVEKIKKAKTFNQGFGTVEYLASAIYDMKLHMNTDSQAKVDANEFETRTMREISCPKEIIMRHRPTAFGHIFSGDVLGRLLRVHLGGHHVRRRRRGLRRGGQLLRQAHVPALARDHLQRGELRLPRHRVPKLPRPRRRHQRAHARPGVPGHVGPRAREARGRPMVNRLPRRLGVAMLAAASLAWAPPTEAKPNLGKKLLSATLQGDNAGVRELLGQGADPNYADKEGCTPLIVAAGGCSYEMHVGAHGELWKTPAASRGTDDMVRALLAAGAAPDSADAEHVTPLMYAARFRRTEAIRALLGAHADPNRQDAQGVTALHSVAAAGDTQAVGLLLGAGAKIDAKSIHGAAPLGVAASQGRLDAVRVLLAAGADAKGADAQGQTWLCSAAYGGFIEIMGALVDAGADVAARDDQGNTALMNAAFKGQTDAAAWLLEHGAEINAKNKDGLTARSLARRGGHAEVAALLESKGGTN